MAIPGNIQALIAAFAFGIVVNAASAALFLHVRGHGSRIFRDGLRLVLTSFLAGAALWAQVDFIATVIDVTAASACQVAIGFSAAFDQLARFSLEQFLLWAVNNGAKMSTAEMLVPQVVLLGRFVLGAVFVGVSRPQFNPVCVARTDVLPVGVAVVALDAVIILALLVRAFQVGLVRDVQERRPGAVRSKALLWVLVGLAVWTGASVPMLLGITSIDLIVRTAIPAAALSILVGLVTAFAGTLLISRARASVLPPEAPSPRDIPTRDLQSRDLSTSDSDYPPSRYEDLKGEEIMTVSAFMLPRGAPRPEDASRKGSLPTITQPVPGQAMAGMGGMAVTGQLFPPMRVEPAPSVREPMTSRANSVRPKKKDGKLVISNPILQDDTNPLKKIATIDLATAARNEQVRRDQALQRSSSLIAKRPAPQPPNLSPEEVMRRNQSVRRKEVASMASNDELKAQPVEVPPAELMPVTAATTSSAQLSPGVEELRRRSPRQPPQLLSEKGAELDRISPKPELDRPVGPPRRPERPASMTLGILEDEPTSSPVPIISPSLPPPPPAVRAPSPEKRAPSPEQDYVTSVMARNASVRANIRPSRQRPASPPPATEEAPKAVPAIQKRSAAGLPSNPRAQAMRTLAKEAGLQNEQTVMFVNNIEYNDPSMVESIIQGANDRAKASADGLRPSKSVVHRPRPIPRKPDKDRPIFPAEPSPNQHKRTKSGGSITSRKSILRSTPGSPTKLPPLPPPPKDPRDPFRPLPNDTKSMTFEEKMALLYAQGPLSGGSSATASTLKRMSSVPDLPPVPASFLDMNKSPSDDFSASNKMRSPNGSDRTTKTSVLEIHEIRREPSDKNVSKFSVDTYRNLADEVGQSWLPGISDGESNRLSSYVGAKRQSSPVLGVRPSSPSEFSDIKTRDGVASDWASMHSPVAAVAIQQAKSMPKATWIAPRDAKKPEWQESMTIMLDPSTPHDRDLERQNWFEDGDMPALGGSRQGGQWHRRVGEECPSFSDREKLRSRKMVPPTPLLLNMMSNKAAIIIPAPEPSPLESPQHALEAIQEQLKKLDQPDEDSNATQRLALLENLELEMGQQEDHWHEMQHDIGRDSLSTVKTSPNRDSVVEPVPALPKDLSQRTNIAADRRASRRAAMRRNSVARQSAEVDAGGWQQRLAEAQMAYPENASDLLAKRKFNFTTLSKAQLGSPTPPDTDESDMEDGIDSRIMGRRAAAPQRATKLWAPTPTSGAPTPSTAVLWTPGPRMSPIVESSELSSAPVRPVSRKSLQPLAIESSELWQVPMPGRLAGSSDGLWMDSQPPPKPQLSLVLPEFEFEADTLAELQTDDLPQTQSQKAPRPVTQRPPRRSRRMTLLPDILESPEPLPDKRGTLGIFQFPWGEKSDTATIHTRPSGMFMAMPGTMSSGVAAMNATLEARSKQIEAQEYSSSFFDDYDDDDEISDIEEEGSDDGFDDATLWEIASLLKTDQKSFMPQQGYQGRAQALEVDDYMAEVPSDEEGDGEAKHDSIVVAIEADDFPMPPRRQGELWDAKAGQADESDTGLSHISDEAWQKYIPAADNAVRVKSRTTTPASIESHSLWNAAHKTSHGRHPSQLWSQKMPMWSVPVKTKSTETRGLFSLSHKRSDYRHTTAEPAALHMIRKPRVSQEPLPRLTSTMLWSPREASTHAHHWISGKTVSKSSLLHEIEVIPSSRVGLKQPAWWEAKTVRYPMRSEQKPGRGKISTSSQPSHLPLRRQRRRSVALRADWDAALQEAIAASYPRYRPRRSATLADWDAALMEAISAGRLARKEATAKEWDAALQDAIAQAIHNDVTKRHPAFATVSHTPMVKYPMDPAVVNPVFFGSSAMAPEDAHAAEDARKLRRQQTKTIAIQRRLSRSDSGGRRRKDEAFSQSQVSEVHDDVRPVDDHQRSRQRSNAAQPASAAQTDEQMQRQESTSSLLWTKPMVVARSIGHTWVPAAKVASRPAMELVASDAESEALRRKHKEYRKDEVPAKMAALESGFPSESLGLAFGGLWSRLDGEEMRNQRRRGSDRDWLATRRTNRVQFRY